MLRERIAELSIGASTLRNQGAINVVKKAREYLKGMSLKKYSYKNRKKFKTVLDNETESLRRSLPYKARNWGAARKALNIFLRDVVYNRHLCEIYKLRRLESWLEVPLDSFVAKALANSKEGKARALPKWKSIKDLSKEDSVQYQDVAEQIARRRKTKRVHLDLYCWRQKDSEKVFS